MYGIHHWGVTPRDTELDTASLTRELSGAFNVHSVVVGGRTFVYVASYTDSGLAAFELASDGSLTSIQDIPDDAQRELSSAGSVASATVGGVTYLYAGGNLDGGISAFRIGADGTLTSIQDVDDPGTLRLSGNSDLATVTIGSTSFLVAPGFADNGFSVFRINADGTLFNTDNESDTAAARLGGAWDVTTATIGSRTFIFVAGQNEDGVSVYELDSAGNATFVSSVDDTASAGLQLDGAEGVATATVGATTYLIASGYLDDGVSVFSVSSTGQLTNVFNIEDTGTLGLNGASGVTAFTLDGETLVAVSGRGEGAVSLFHLGADGSLTSVSTLLDSASLALLSSYNNTLTTAGGNAILVATGFADGGVSTFDIGSGNDTLNGMADADIILGIGGDDRLNGAAGNDRLAGGVGDDVLLGRAGRDTLLGLNGTDELAGGRDNDSLLGGNRADILWGGQGRDRMEGGGGADDFIYRKVTESGTTNATRDVILDFKGRDDLVFTDLDANRGQAGNQDFTFDTGGAFAAGELRFREVARGVLVELNVDSDGAAELSVLLEDFTGVLNSNDFEL